MIEYISHCTRTHKFNPTTRQLFLTLLKWVRSSVRVNWYNFIQVNEVQRLPLPENLVCIYENTSCFPFCIRAEPRLKSSEIYKEWGQIHRCDPFNNDSYAWNLLVDPVFYSLPSFTSLLTTHFFKKVYIVQLHIPDTTIMETI